MKKINKKGFTLVELLAVIVILGVLLLIAVPSVTNIIEKSRKSAFESQVKLALENVATVFSVATDSEKDFDDCVIPIKSIKTERGSFDDYQGGITVTKEDDGSFEITADVSNGKFSVSGGTLESFTVESGDDYEDAAEVSNNTCTWWEE